LTIRILNILPFILLVLTGPVLNAQSFYETYLYGNDREIRAKAAVQLLHESALIVRLPSNNKKLEKLEQLAASGELEEKETQKYKKEADVLRLETQHMQRVWMDAFMQYYDFSRLYFLEDKDYRAFLSGKRNGIFMNEEGAKDPTIHFNQLNYLVAGFGNSQKSDQYSGGTGIYIMDPRGNELDKPFPHYLTTRTHDQFIGIMMNDGSREQRNAEKIVQRLQKKLGKYCEQVCGEILPPVSQ
jgi:hypothetical protein